VEITKQNRDRQQEEIGGISSIMTQQFDEFADEHPDSQCPHCPPVYIAIKGLGCFVTQVDEKAVAEEGWG
jgi:hypothetical protein